ncbi:MAG: non-ribosomal peptide synthetase [Rhodobiaceae bacterium]|nr:non-ribosomal peptide synthetase [Rhodobiaceae bacterium]
MVNPAIGPTLEGGVLVSTSGTTGLPKFARIGSRALLNRFFANYTRRPAVTRLQNFPFDGVTGLWMVFPTADVEGYMQPQRMMAMPAEYLGLVEQFKIASIGLTSSMLEKVLTTIEAGKTSYDLSSVTRFGLGAEMIVPELVTRLAVCLKMAGATNTAINFGYGSSEMGTICATNFTQLQQALDAIGDGSAPVSVGGCLEDVSLRIVDDENQPLPVGESGNIQVRSDMKMFSGYAGLGGDDVSCFVDGWLKTGDVGFIENDELRVTGRQEAKIIVNGKNISLERIETALRKIRGLPVSAVIAAAIRSPGGTTEELALFFVPAATDSEDMDMLVRRLRRETAKVAGITAKHLVPITESDIVRTPTQKIRRQPLVDTYLAGKLRRHVMPPRRRETVDRPRSRRSAMPESDEAWLGELWRRVLKLNAVPEADEDFFELGGDSLAAAEMIFAVEAKFGVGLPLESYYSDPTLRGLSAILSSPAPDDTVAAQPAAGRLSGAGVLRELDLFQSTWRGVRKFPGSLVAGHNVTGTRMPLFWVFQDDDEATRLARNLHRYQPLYAMRSLVGIIPVREYTAEVLDSVCDRYLWEILAIAGDRPIAIGGNCQAAIIALALARRLRQIGRTPEVLVLMEWGYSLGPYRDFTGILYSREGHVADAYLKPGESGPDWQRDFPDRRVYETTGAYGEIFYEENVDSVAGPLAELLREAVARKPMGRARLRLWEMRGEMLRTATRIGKEYGRFKRRWLAIPPK